MNLFKRSQKGFTLIELLVVVAIIGILAATILAALGGARAKARLARAQSEGASLRAAQELWYNQNSYSYVGGFTQSSTGALNLVNSIKQYDATAAGWEQVSGWAFSFKDPSGVVYCFDSNGYSGKATAAPATGVLCTPAP